MNAGFAARASILVTGLLPFFVISQIELFSYLMYNRWKVI